MAFMEYGQRYNRLFLTRWLQYLSVSNGEQRFSSGGYLTIVAPQVIHSRFQLPSNSHSWLLAQLAIDTNVLQSFWVYYQQPLPVAQFISALEPSLCVKTKWCVTLERLTSSATDSPMGTALEIPVPGKLNKAKLGLQSS